MKKSKNTPVKWPKKQQTFWKREHKIVECFYFLVFYTHKCMCNIRWKITKVSFSYVVLCVWGYFCNAVICTLRFPPFFYLPFLFWIRFGFSVVFCSCWRFAFCFGCCSMESVLFGKFWFPFRLNHGVHVHILFVFYVHYSCDDFCAQMSTAQAHQRNGLKWQTAKNSIQNDA